jgi:hypothetical protein
MSNRLLCEVCGDALPLDEHIPLLTEAEIITFVDAHAKHEQIAVKLEVATFLEPPQQR